MFANQFLHPVSTTHGALRLGLKLGKPLPYPLHFAGHHEGLKLAC